MFNPGPNPVPERDPEPECITVPVPNSGKNSRFRVRFHNTDFDHFSCRIRELVSMDSEGCGISGESVAVTMVSGLKSDSYIDRLA
jgi:hypothetical protein